MSLTNLLAVQPGAFVSEITADVSDAKPMPTKTGKTFFKCKLTDGQNIAYATSFNQTFEHVNGKRVTFKGMGIKRQDDFMNVAQVVIGDKAKWVIGAVSSPSAAQEPPVATHTPTAPQTPVKSQGNATGGAISNRVEGVTAGQALNKAVDMYLKTVQPCEDIDLEAAGLWIHKTASMLIRLSGALQDGKLAAPLHHKAEPPPITQPEQPQGADPF